MNRISGVLLLNINKTKQNNTHTKLTKTRLVSSLAVCNITRGHACLHSVKLAHWSFDLLHRTTSYDQFSYETRASLCDNQQDIYNDIYCYIRGRQVSFIHLGRNRNFCWQNLTKGNIESCVWPFIMKFR